MAKISENKKGLKVILTGAVLQLFLGIIYVWSVFVVPVSEFYSWETGNVKLTSSFMLCFFVVGILLGGKLQIKIGVTKVVLIGGLMVAVSMLVTSFIPLEAPFLIYIFYGITGGFGVGAAYNAILTSAQKWFPENRGFATGVSVCAFGFSTVVFAPLIETFISNFGLKNTFLILAGIFMVAVISLFHFIKLPEENTANNASSSKVLQGRQFGTFEILKTPQFYMLTFSLMLATAAFFILNPSFKSLAVERGLEPTIGTVVVMLTGIANALGRLITPLMSDKIGRENAAIIIIGVTALGTFSLCFVSGVLFMAVIAIIAFCYGGFSGIYPVLTSEYFGMKNIGSNYGAVMVGFALSALFFPMILNVIEDITVKFIILGSLAIIGVVLVLILSFLKKKSL